MHTFCQLFTVRVGQPVFQCMFPPEDLRCTLMHQTVKMPRYQSAATVCVPRQCVIVILLAFIAGLLGTVNRVAFFWETDLSLCYCVQQRQSESPVQTTSPHASLLTPGCAVQVLEMLALLTYIQLHRLWFYSDLKCNAFSLDHSVFCHVLLCYVNIMACVQAIRLTPLQVEQVLIWREEHLRNMLAVYEQRQQLNVEVTFC